MKRYLLVAVIILTFAKTLTAQNKPVNFEIDLLLMRGDYNKAIDTCKQILAYDSLNPDIHYKMGIAYQNIMEDNLSFTSYYRAANLGPDNKVFKFALAKGYYSKGKYNLAEPLFSNLYSSDSLNWVYAYYLSAIFMQHNKYDNAINIYKRFLKKDSANYTYLDKIAYASLKKGDFEYAIDLYNKSLSLNNNNITAIKNLAYLYSSTEQPDTAILLLTKGIEIDSSDMGLYAGRAQLNYSKNYTKRAMDDYLVILASGDSSKMYLKRIGIGYCYNFQPKEAIDYLLLAYKTDSSDYETCSYLGQCYYKIKDMKNSSYYYDKAIKILTPVYQQLGLTYSLYAESQKADGMYKEAIDSYQKMLGIRTDPNTYMIIANIYDEKLNNKKKAIYYYEKFLNNIKTSKMTFKPEYLEKIRKRMEYLKETQKKI